MTNGFAVALKQMHYSDCLRACNHSLHMCNLSAESDKLTAFLDSAY